MENPEKPEQRQEENPEKDLERNNPNTIGELLSFGGGIETFPDRVYRGIRGKAAVDDIEASGIVRNAQSAGVVQKSRWGERVFWSKGAEGKFHSVQENGYVIEAPLSVAQERIVRKEDITAIYTRSEDGVLSDILKQRRDAEEQTRVRLTEERTQIDQDKLADVRRSLGLDEQT